ncbi:MAG: hypothetical protein M3O62_17500 [Pseudomonadota bacterium]|nr:hypothetical protein [Pseudomonadota bacterium]
MNYTTLASAAALLAFSLVAGAAETGETVAATTEKAMAAEPQPNCLQNTGSRIKPDADRPCISAPGQVITRDQLDRTGAATTAEALRKASPAVR